MNRILRRQAAAAQRKITRRLRKAEGGREPRSAGPEFATGKVHYEMSDRIHAIACGGLGVLHQLAKSVGLVDALDQRLPILKRRRPYSEADHILNIVYNALCGGLVLEDIEIRRTDVAFLDARSAPARFRTLQPRAISAADSTLARSVC